MSGSVYNINVRIQFSLLIMPVNTNSPYNRRIPYYAYYTCQSRSSVIKTYWLETLSVFQMGPGYGSRAYPGPWPRLLTLNQALTTRQSGNMYNMYNRNKNRTGCQSPHRNPTEEPSFDCATFILGLPKIQMMSPLSIFLIPV